MILLLVCLSQSSFSQKWFDASDMWVYRMEEGFSAIQGYCEYSNVRDTLVNGLPAKAIDGYHRYYSFQFDRIEDYTSVSLYYEKDNRIYAFDFLDSLNLIYDFNLQVGDSMTYVRPFSCESDGTIDTIVMHLDSLGTLPFNNEELVVQHFSYTVDNFSTTLEVIETLGATGVNFNLNEVLSCQSFHPIMEQLCSFSDDFFDIQLRDEDCFFVLTNVDDSDPIEFSMYPNPVEDVLFVETDLNNFTLKLYDVHGQLISTHQEEWSVDFSLLDVGIYLVEFNSGSERRFVKVVKN